ncbi:MAG: MMPL family transporter, partial [Solirubrobacteraceae bacterium]
RDRVIPAASGGQLRVLVGGSTAIFNDFAGVLAGKLPLFVGVVVLLSFLLLMAVFRSLVIPAMAALMNLLAVGAAFGVVTAVFQWGWLAELIGVTRTGPIEAFLPVMVFAILFGLSMDYEVFLVSRIYEEWHKRRDNRAAVVHGLAATGRTITAAAAIMVLVFAAFVLGGERVIKLFGVGLASAVLLDALVIRRILVPGLLLALGERNWYLPKALDRILPRLNVEGAPKVEEPSARPESRRPALGARPAEET